MLNFKFIMFIRNTNKNGYIAMTSHHCQFSVVLNLLLTHGGDIRCIAFQSMACGTLSSDVMHLFHRGAMQLFLYLVSFRINHLFVYPSILLSIHWSVCPFDNPSIYLYALSSSIQLFICPYVQSTVRSFVYHFSNRLFVGPDCHSSVRSSYQSI